MDKKAMNCLSYGLFVLTTKVGEKDNGCIINTVQQVTSDPNRISITVNRANYTHDMIKESGVFTVSTISQQAKFDLFKHFGFQSGGGGGFTDRTQLEKLVPGLEAHKALWNGITEAKLEEWLAELAL